MPDNDSPEKMTTDELLRQDVLDVLANLTDLEHKVVRLRFGLDDGIQRTLEETSEQLGMSREQVRQIEKAALRPLRPVPRCTFCGARQPDATHLFKGQAATICLKCLEAISEFLHTNPPDPTKHNHVCYFCNAEQSEAGNLYLSDRANICPHCVEQYLP